MTKVSRRQRFRGFIRKHIAKRHHSNSNHLGTEKTGPPSANALQSPGTDGGPLVIAKSMSAEICDGDELYRVSFSTADSQGANILAIDGGLVETVGDEESRPESPQNPDVQQTPLEITGSISLETDDEKNKLCEETPENTRSMSSETDGEKNKLHGEPPENTGSISPETDDEKNKLCEGPPEITESKSPEANDERNNLCGDSGSLAGQTSMITVGLDDSASVTESVQHLKVGESTIHEDENYLISQESKKADLPEKKTPVVEVTKEPMSLEMKKLQKLSISTGIPLKKPPLRILSLDGNGVRVMSQLWTLRKIMRGIQYDAVNIHGANNPGSLRPSDFFDIISGSSTGGLIAIVLGALEMRLDDCLDEYKRIAPKIFAFEKESKRRRLSKMFKGDEHDKKTARFSSEPLEAEIKEMVVKWLGKRAVEGTETKLRVDDRNVCKILVCVRSAETGEQLRIRSYEGSSESYTQDYTIWQACRAVLAEPTLFDPITLGPNNITYIDSGIENHNPIRAVLDESSKIWGESQAIGCILSIGTGFPGLEYKGKEKVLFDYCLKSTTANETIANAFDMEICDKYGFDQKIYWRFNVSGGLEEAGIPEMDRQDVLELSSIWHYQDNSESFHDVDDLLFKMLRDHYKYLHTINRAILKRSR